MRVLLRVVLGAVLLAVVAGGAGIYYVRGYLPSVVAPKSFPQIDGELGLDGLGAPVDIYRDSFGIPHIYADNVHDLFFAQGYVHAQDRFWQMDTWRHIGSGRLAEMFGEGTVETDAFLRTLGWRQVAEQELAQMSPHGMEILEAYAGGVNAYLQTHDPVELSLEYSVLGLLSPDYEIEPWEPVHTVTWGKAMAWDLRGNIDDEIERAILLKELSPEAVDQLFPAYPQDHPLIVPEFDVGQQTRERQVAAIAAVPSRLLEAVERNVSLLGGLLGAGGDGIGSNSWVVGGTRTASGMPLFANDPHLSSQMPSIWYQVDLQCRVKSADCPYSVAGFSFAGVPGVVIGHNDSIVWGFTNVEPDVMDLYIEKLNPKNSNQYEVNGKWVDFETRTESIQVAGGQAVEVEVRVGRHGPIVSDTYGPLLDEGDPKDEAFVPFRERSGVELPEDYAIALAWTALTPGSLFEAVWGLNQAEDWDEFRSAARQFDVPPQNLLYADVLGNIGYQMPGKYPVRATGDGTLPVPGWASEFDWTGYLDFENLPFTFNPPEDFIVAANNQTHPIEYPFLISTGWDYGFRAQRITDLIESSAGPLDISDMQAIQADSLNPIATDLVPLIGPAVRAGAEGGPANSERLLQVLDSWDQRAEANSPGAAVFEAFWNRLLRNTFGDELPEEYWPGGGSRWIEIIRQITPDVGSLWWDDRSTPDIIETRDPIIATSFGDAIGDLENLLGRDPEKWEWGRLHTVTFRNGTLGDSGVGPIEDLFNRGPFPTGGGDSIVNATAWDAQESFEVDSLPSMRMIVDLGDFNNSVAVHTTGQSGHAYHAHYTDMVSLWTAVQYNPMLWAPDEIISSAEGHLVLHP